MPRTRFLRFPLAADDQALIDPAAVEVEDVPFAAAPAARMDYPQSSRVRFRLREGGTTPLPVRPLFPGTLGFVRDDPAAPVPAPAYVSSRAARP